LHIDVGYIQLVGSSYLQHAGDPQHAPIGVQVDAGGQEVLEDLNVVETLTEVERHMEGLPKV